MIRQADGQTTQEASLTLMVLFKCNNTIQCKEEHVGDSDTATSLITCVVRSKIKMCEPCNGRFIVYFETCGIYQLPLMFANNVACLVLTAMNGS